MSAKKLRLVLFSECNRACPGCCNGGWELDKIPLHDGVNFGEYCEVMLTGGEPMLNPELVRSVATQAPWHTMVYIYTAKSAPAQELVDTLHYLDGITLTLHEQYDVPKFIKFNKLLNDYPVLEDRSFCLNVFSHVDLTGVDTSRWKVKDNMEWIVDCPLPDGEVLMKLSTGAPLPKYKRLKETFK